MNLLLLSYSSPLNPPILGDFKIHFSPRIGDLGAIHTFNQQRQILSAHFFWNSDLSIHVENPPSQKEKEDFYLEAGFQDFVN